MQARPAAAIERAAMRIARKKGTLPEMMRQAERLFLAKAVKAHGGNRTQAAAALGIARETIHKKLTKHRLDFPPPAREIKKRPVLPAAPMGALKKILLRVERWFVDAALGDHGGNKSKTAVILGIRRETLHHKLRLDIQPVPRDLKRTVTRIDRNKGALKDWVRQVERKLLTDALREHRGNKTRAAAALGVARDLLYKKMDKVGLHAAAFPRRV